MFLDIANLIFKTRLLTNASYWLIIGKNKMKSSLSTKYQLYYYVENDSKLVFLLFTHYTNVLLVINSSSNIAVERRF